MASTTAVSTRGPAAAQNLNIPNNTGNGVPVTIKENVDQKGKPTPNGVPAFRRPESKNAATTLVWMGIILGSLFMGVQILAHHLRPYPSEKSTVFSQMGVAVWGSGTFMYVLLQFATAAILTLAASRTEDLAQSYERNAPFAGKILDPELVEALRGKEIRGDAAKAKLHEVALDDYACGWKVERDAHGLKAHHTGGVRGYACLVSRWLETDALVVFDDAVLLSNSKPLAALALKHRIAAAGVDKFTRGWEKPSDHVPVWVEIAEA